MTSTKKVSSPKKQGGRGAAAKNTAKAGSFEKDIFLLTALAACLILMVSVLGFGGVIGNVICSMLFGAVGMAAYAVPVVLFIALAFLISNGFSLLVMKKILAGLLFLVSFCGLVQLLTEGYIPANTLEDYYHVSADYQIGGGFAGGLILIPTITAFGKIGAIVIFILVLLATFIIITQRSFFGFIYRIVDFFSDKAAEGRLLYEEGEPERQLKKELKAQQKQRIREEKRARRLSRLEQALAEEEELAAQDDGEYEEFSPFSLTDLKRQEKRADGREAESLPAAGKRKTAGKAKDLQLEETRNERTKKSGRSRKASVIPADEDYENDSMDFFEKDFKEDFKEDFEKDFEEDFEENFEENFEEDSEGGFLSGTWLSDSRGRKPGKKKSKAMASRSEAADLRSEAAVSRQEAAFSRSEAPNSQSKVMDSRSKAADSR
ncbi:MAG: DNA translocase FtsK 4TM domain-containing protein, partial [Blautia sp.]|nr:DNA translocase FtsK 4TM domain-containing protein [Blautia sp.]